MAGVFRPLRADEIECRVQMCKFDEQNQRKSGVSLLLYKTARTDADLLDEIVGCQYWENDFKLIDGVLYGGIGVDYEKNGHYVWKWDAGTESNTEAEKGRASDAYKRAGFKHGIGRELYTAPFIWISGDKCTIRKDNKGKAVCKDTFTVQKIAYENGNIIALEIYNKDTLVYSMQTVDTPTQKVAYTCKLCEHEITPYTGANGKTVSLAKHLARSREIYGDDYCITCISSGLLDGERNAG